MLGVRFKNKLFCKKVIKECYRKKILTFYFLNEKNCMRISPSLNIKDTEIIKSCKKIIKIINYCKKN